jgi:hypothetical protein
MANESFPDSQEEAADGLLVQQGMAIDDACLNQGHEGTIGDCRPRPRDATLIDFAAIHNAAMVALPDLLSDWLPGGRREGKEFIALNPRRADQGLG